MLHGGTSFLLPISVVFIFTSRTNVRNVVFCNCKSTAVVHPTKPLCDIKIDLSVSIQGSLDALIENAHKNKLMKIHHVLIILPAATTCVRSIKKLKCNG